MSHRNRRDWTRTGREGREDRLNLSPLDLQQELEKGEIKGNLLSGFWEREIEIGGESLPGSGCDQMRRRKFRGVMILRHSVMEGEELLR